MVFEFSESEFNEVIEKYFIQQNPLVLKEFPSKEKKKYLCLMPIMSIFDKSKIYSEKEINEMIKTVYAYDYCIIRRYLVDYGFLSRSKDGRTYWVDEVKL